MNIFGYIKEIKYTATLCRELKECDSVESALSQTACILNIANNRIALSKWVSPKRTRSYPYARVYDTLNFLGKRVTIIPAIKDEGIDGDRDFLQWDTLSLMSLLDVYVIIGYYDEVEKNKDFDNKITNQKYNVKHIESEISKIFNYHSSALHWNLGQANDIYTLSLKALNSYENISKKLNVSFHNKESALRKISIIKSSRDLFIEHSRLKAKEAQEREVKTLQPKENILEGKKATITIKNYLGGNYYLTADEYRIKKDVVSLIEAKHSSKSNAPSIDDIKDGLIKMILFSNLTDVYVNDNNYKSKAVLKLTGIGQISKDFLEYLKYEEKINNFTIEAN